MSPQRAITKVTRGYQITIPKSVREKLGFRVGDVVEVATDNAGRMVAWKLEFKGDATLEWKTGFAKKYKITEAGIVRISRSARREVFKREYE